MTSSILPDTLDTDCLIIGSSDSGQAMNDLRPLCRRDAPYDRCVQNDPSFRRAAYAPLVVTLLDARRRRIHGVASSDTGAVCRTKPKLICEVYVDGSAGDGRVRPRGRP